jgi:hypothetical protein
MLDQVRDQSGDEADRERDTEGDAVLRDGQLVFMLERSQIENRTADQIAAVLTGAFDQICATPANA